MALQDKLHVVLEAEGVQMGLVASKQLMGCWWNCAKCGRWCFQEALYGVMFNSVLLVLVLCRDEVHQVAAVTE